MLISSVNPWAIIAPIIAAQYVLALVALYFLSRRAPSIKSYVLWSLLILLVFFAGSIVFLIYNRVRPGDAPSEVEEGQALSKERSDEGEDKAKETESES